MIEKIKFYVQDIDFELKDEDEIRQWLKDSIKSEGQTYRSITYVFVDDDALLKINKTHLDHDTLTDIITFPYAYEPIETEIYISIDRIKENADIHNETFERELKRVIIHGLLHMMGYGDKSEEEAKLMREKEDFYLKFSQS